jgi:hypothetical protein
VVLSGASPLFEIASLRSISPDAYLQGASPRRAPTSRERLKIRIIDRGHVMIAVRVPTPGIRRRQVGSPRTASSTILVKHSALLAKSGAGSEHWTQHRCELRIVIHQIERALLKAYLSHAVGELESEGP